MRMWTRGTSSSCVKSALVQVAVLMLVVATAALLGCGSPPASSGASQPPSSENAPSAGSAPQLPPNQLHITKADFGDAWPFTVDEGVLTGTGSGGVGEVTFTTNGVTYGVNGLANGTGKYAEIEAIWAANPSIPGTKKDIGPIIKRGLELCQ